ncbi:RNA polymerase II transcriptional coactivator [Nymphaea thermarum]|nr:RNA polymerase II transcriptional coactivator [Nymphaea thermarum]
MDTETKRRVEKMVVGILEKADMTEMTEFKVRSLASERLGIDLSGSREVKKFVRGIVENFLASRAAQAEGGGISLTTEQWAAFKKAVPAIEKAIREIQSDSGIG